MSQKVKIKSSITINENENASVSLMMVSNNDEDIVIYTTTLASMQSRVISDNNCKAGIRYETVKGIKNKGNKIKQIKPKSEKEDLSGSIYFEFMRPDDTQVMGSSTLIFDFNDVTGEASLIIRNDNPAINGVLHSGSTSSMPVHYEKVNQYAQIWFAAIVEFGDDGSSFIYPATEKQIDFTDPDNLFENLEEYLGSDATKELDPDKFDVYVDDLACTLETVIHVQQNPIKMRKEITCTTAESD